LQIGVSRYELYRLGGIVASGCNSGRLGGGIVDFEHVQAAAHLLGGGILGSNSCKAFRFVLLLA
jgi:hypothetical protein